MILRSDTLIGQRGRKTFVLLGCERGGKYRQYKKDLKVTESGTRKCGCPFRLRGYPVRSGEGWILKLICGSHNHELANILVGHPYAGRFTCSEKSMLMVIHLYWTCSWKSFCSGLLNFIINEF